MKTIKEVLKTKGNKIFSITPEESVFDAIKTMAENKISSLLVLEDKQLIGIMTERDYAWKVILNGKASKTTKVREIMTKDILYVGPLETCEECMALMTEKRVRHLPVLENEELVGLVSIGDLVKVLIEDQKFIIKQLEHYLHN